MSNEKEIKCKVIKEEEFGRFPTLLKAIREWKDSNTVDIIRAIPTIVPNKIIRNRHHRAISIFYTQG